MIEKDFIENVDAFIEKRVGKGNEGTFKEAFEAISQTAEVSVQEWVDAAVSKASRADDSLDSEAYREGLYKAVAASIAEQMPEGHMEYYADYTDDFSSPEMLGEVLSFDEKDLASRNTDVRSAFKEAVWDVASDWEMEAEFSDEEFLVEQVSNDLQALGFNGPEVSFSALHDVLMEMPSYYYDFPAAKYAMADVYQATLFFATESEYQQEFTTSFDIKDYFDGKTSLEDEDLQNSALTYLIHQQGYTWNDVLGDTPNKDNAFPRSMREELNNGYDFGALVLLADMSADNLITLKEHSMSPENDAVITIPSDKSFYFGLFDPVNGGGSILEIELEKPFELPTSLIKSIDIASDSSIKKYNTGFYGVGEVYGLSGDAWTDFTLADLKFDENPARAAQLQENFKGETVKDLQCDTEPMEIGR